MSTLLISQNLNDLSRPTIREKFDAYRFADHKDKVIDLAAGVTRINVDTQAITGTMHDTSR